MSETKLPEINNSSSAIANQSGSEFRNSRSHDGASDIQSNSSTRFQKKSLAQVKRERKQVELDAQLLANRIALLRQEELRTWKKIEETRKRVKEVLDTKKKSEEKKHRLDAVRERNVNGSMQNRRAINVMRHERSKERKNVQFAIQQARREEALQMRAQSEEIRKQKKTFIIKSQEQNANKSAHLRDQLRRAKLRQQEMKRKQLEDNKRRYMERVQEQEDNRVRKEQEISHMEMLEMELIKKLQNTQMQQKSVYEELEAALTTKPKRKPSNTTNQTS